MFAASELVELVIMSGLATVTKGTGLIVVCYFSGSMSTMQRRQDNTPHADITPLQITLKG